MQHGRSNVVLSVISIHLLHCSAGRAFCQLLRESDAAFEEVYCVMFAVLDEVWLEQKASYMQFNAVLKEVRGRLDAALQTKPQSIQQLKQRVGLQW